MSEPSDALRTALDAAPGSIRSLARDAGVSPRLLTLVRDGERRLTRETRDRVLRVLREREARYGEAVEALETTQPEPRS